MTGTESGSPLPPPPEVVMQYEMLRRATLGEGLPVEARSGLTLFLRRGMWGWARAMVIPSASPPTRLASSNWTAPAAYRAAVHIFAAMAIHTNEGASP